MERENSLIIPVNSPETLRLVTRFSRLYGIARRLREDLILNPQEAKNPVWFLWKDDEGNPVMQGNKQIGTPAKKIDVFNATNHMADRTYRDLIKIHKKRVANDIIRMYEKEG